MTDQEMPPEVRAMFDRDPNLRLWVSNSGRSWTRPSEHREFVKYLMSLVRMDIRKKERSLEKFAPRPDQAPDEAAEVKKKFEGDIAFREQAYDWLKGFRRR